MISLGWRGNRVGNWTWFRSPFFKKRSSLFDIQNIFTDIENITDECFRIGPASSDNPTPKHNTCIDFTIERYGASINIPARWDPDIRALCQFTECLTIDNRVCKFPFRYKGKLYDTCIEIDSDVPWCSLSTDYKGNHIENLNNRGLCSPSCFVQDCPVGFFFHDSTCIHISARTYPDITRNMLQAETQCKSKGARLYQPRDYTNLDSLINVENEFLKPGFPLFYYYSTTSYNVIGAYTMHVYPGLQIQYMDGSRAYMIEKKILLQGALRSTSISNIDTYTGKACVMLDTNGLFTLELCTTHNPTSYLAYICEAKTIYTKDTEKNSSCHFPFKLPGHDTLITSCIINATTNTPWCATEVDGNGIMKSDKLGTCTDEREITYRGGGDGNDCIFPYSYDRIWYDICTFGAKDEIWCPTKLNPSREFDEKIDEYAYCTEFMGSAGSECSPNYEKINGSCIRVSAYAENFNDASLKCAKEGAFLLTILEDTLIPFIKKYIEILSETKMYFQPEYSPDLSSYWVGGRVIDLTWRWMSNGKNFSIYSNWKDGKENTGCIDPSLCTDNYGLTVESTTFQWVAEDKAKLKPYICQSKCKLGYKWYSNVQKCLKVTDLSHAVSFDTASYKCAKDHARLTKFESCTDLPALSKDIWKVNHSPLDQFWVGFLGGGLEDYKARRITSNQRTLIKTVSSNGYAPVSGCPWITTFDYSNRTLKGFIKSFSANPLTAELNFESVKETGDISLKGFICEFEESWTCPDNYILFQEECYLICNHPKSFTEALVDCNNNKSHLFEPMTQIHLQFITEILKQKLNNSLNIWTGYRRQLHSIKSEPNKFFHTSDYSETGRTFTGVTGRVYLVPLHSLSLKTNFVTLNHAQGLFSFQDHTIVNVVINLLCTKKVLEN